MVLDFEHVTSEFEYISGLDLVNSGLVTNCTLTPPNKKFKMHISNTGVSFSRESKKLHNIDIRFDYHDISRLSLRLPHSFTRNKVISIEFSDRPGVILKGCERTAAVFALIRHYWALTIGQDGIRGNASAAWLACMPEPDNMTIDSSYEPFFQTDDPNAPSRSIPLKKHPLDQLNSFLSQCRNIDLNNPIKPRILGQFDASQTDDEIYGVGNTPKAAVMMAGVPTALRGDFTHVMTGEVNVKDKAAVINQFLEVMGMGVLKLFDVYLNEDNGDQYIETIKSDSMNYNFAPEAWDYPNGRRNVYFERKLKMMFAPPRTSVAQKICVRLVIPGMAINPEFDKCHPCPLLLSEPNYQGSRDTDSVLTEESIVKNGPRLIFVVQTQAMDAPFSDCFRCIIRYTFESLPGVSNIFEDMEVVRKKLIGVLNIEDPTAPMEKICESFSTHQTPPLDVVKALAEIEQDRCLIELKKQKDAGQELVVPSGFKVTSSVHTIIINPTTFQSQIMKKSNIESAETVAFVTNYLKKLSEDEILRLKNLI